MEETILTPIEELEEIIKTVELTFDPREKITAIPQLKEKLNKLTK